MATETTRSPFVPALTRFNQFLQQHMQMQAQLAERQYKFGREEKGRELATYYSDLINKTSDPGKLSQVLAEGVSAMYKAGVPEATQMISQMANVKTNALNYQQKQDFAVNTMKSYETSFKGVKFQYGDTQRNFEDIVKDLPSDPMQAVQIAEQIINTGGLRRDSAVGMTPGGGAAGGTYDIDKYGRQTNYTPYVSKGAELYEDTGEVKGKYDPGDKPASPEAGAKFSTMYTSKLESEKNRAVSQGSLSRGVYTDYTTGKDIPVLQDRFGRLYNIKDGQRGDLITSDTLVPSHKYEEEKGITRGQVLSARDVRKRYYLDFNNIISANKMDWLTKQERNLMEEKKGYLPDTNMKEMFERWNKEPSLSKERASLLWKWKEYYLPAEQIEKEKAVEHRDYFKESPYTDIPEEDIVPGMTQFGEGTKEDNPYGLKKSPIGNLYEVEIEVMVDGVPTKQIRRGLKKELESEMLKRSTKLFIPGQAPEWK